MHSFLVSTFTVGTAELGDKTQLLTLLFAARFKKPAPIIAAILVATLLNHGITAWAGAFFSSFFTPIILHGVLTVSFIITAIWALIPDTLDEGEAGKHNKNIFWTVLITFFIAELGDKTQLVTLALSAQYQTVFWVTLGTTLGMMIANVPAVFLGKIWCEKLPFKLIRIVSALIFIALASYEAYQLALLLN
ncbi:TMEM165/GDT1 family protein [Piscirickettsia litoralis]|uniref:GDT1 family protein n=1 Tax=Piscirickettsia litoralis TaxID=1891921 RepID=A0ABX3AAP3_9GAMM|nr:TMEM165/GDT1 family protein [Piscirickettsia litoralis]ODN43199.1 hypothetical protein BGC07_10060 [Piscirickettsia litoralis]